MPGSDLVGDDNLMTVVVSLNLVDEENSSLFIFTFVCISCEISYICIDGLFNFSVKLNVLASGFS